MLFRFLWFLFVSLSICFDCFCLNFRFWMVSRLFDHRKLMRRLRALLHAGHVALRASPAAADPPLEAAPLMRVAGSAEMSVLRNEKFDAAARIGIHQVRSPRRSYGAVEAEFIVRVTAGYTDRACRTRRRITLTP